MVFKAMRKDKLLKCAVVVVVLFSRLVVSNTLQTHGLQHTRLPSPSLSPRVCSNSCPLSQRCHAIMPEWLAYNLPLLLLPCLSQHQGLFQLVSSSHQVTKVLELQLQHQFFQWIFRVDILYGGLVGSPCSPRDSQESSLSPQFESINSLVFSLLYGPALTSVHDYWKNHSFD